MSREEQFDFYWKEIFTGLAYNPIEFNTYRFDQSMSLPGKLNKLYDMFKVLALNNQEVMDYLKEFVETFDFKLETTVKDVLDVWLNEGLLADVVRVAISEEVIEARTDYLDHTYLTLKERLDLEREEVILARGGEANLKVRLDKENQEVTAQLAQTMKQQDVDIVVTIGSDGDYQTINEALNFLSKKTKVHMVNDFKAEIKLLTGFVMQEEVHVHGLDLGWVVITSEDNEVLVDESYVTTKPVLNDLQLEPATFITIGGVLPTIGTIFKYDQALFSGISKDGIVAAEGGRATILPNCGFKYAYRTNIYAKSGFITAYGAIATHALSYGIYSDFGSIIRADGADASFTTNRHCFRAKHGSRLSIRGAIANNAGHTGVHANENSTIDASIVTAKNCTENGVYCDGTSLVNASGIDVSGSNTGIRSQGGGIVNIGIDLDTSTISKINDTLNNGIRILNAGKVTGHNVEILNCNYAIVNTGGEVWGNNFEITGTLQENSVIVDEGGITNLVNSSPVNVSTESGGKYFDENSGDIDYHFSELLNDWTIVGDGLRSKKKGSVVYLSGVIKPGTITKGTVIGYTPSDIVPKTTIKIPITEINVGSPSTTHLVEIRQDRTIRITGDADWNAGTYSLYYLNLIYFLD